MADRRHRQLLQQLLRVVVQAFAVALHEFLGALRGRLIRGLGIGWRAAVRAGGRGRGLHPAEPLDFREGQGFVLAGAQQNDLLGLHRPQRGVARKLVADGVEPTSLALPGDDGGGVRGRLGDEHPLQRQWQAGFRRGLQGRHPGVLIVGGVAKQAGFEDCAEIDARRSPAALAGRRDWRHPRRCGRPGDEEHRRARQAVGDADHEGPPKRLHGLGDPYVDVDVLHFAQRFPRRPPPPRRRRSPRRRRPPPKAG